MIPFLGLVIGAMGLQKKFTCLGWFEFELTSKEDVMVGAKNA